MPTRLQPGRLAKRGAIPDAFVNTKLYLAIDPLWFLGSADGRHI